MKSEYTVEELKAFLYKEQAEELDIPKQPTNIELINEKYGKMSDTYHLKQMYPHKLLREHTTKGNLSGLDKFLLFLSPMLPFVAVWLLLFYIALYGI